ncbi:hypothetical protein EON67_04435, partial [archaeon]
MRVDAQRHSVRTCPDDCASPAHAPGHTRLRTRACALFCALHCYGADDGTVYSFGRNSEGQCGLGACAPLKPGQPAPLRPAVLTQVRSPLRGAHCRAHAAFTAMCRLRACVPYPTACVWSVLRLQLLPAAIPRFFGMRIASIACGAHFSLFLTQAGELYACGDGACGQLGLGRARTAVLTPERVAFPNDDDDDDDATQRTRICAVSAGFAHALALDEASRTWAWGLNNKGQLGCGDFKKRLAPAPVLLDGEQLRANLISAGPYHSAAVSTDAKTVYTWGSASRGRCGHSWVHGPATELTIPYSTRYIDKSRLRLHETGLEDEAQPTGKAEWPFQHGVGALSKEFARAAHSRSPSPGGSARGGVETAPDTWAPPITRSAANEALRRKQKEYAVLQAAVRRTSSLGPAVQPIV